MLEHRSLGKTGLTVTALGYGAMELRQPGIDAAKALHLLNHALDLGINFIDTSPDYCLSETYIGHAVAHRRSEFHLATKCGCNVDEQGNSLLGGHVWTRSHLLGNIENSLRLLKTDHLDVWMLHGVYPEELADGKSDEVIDTMYDLKRQGKTRAVGVSFRNGSQGEALFPAGFGHRDIGAFMEWDVFDVMQIVYGGLTPLNENAVTRAAQRGIGMIIRGVVKDYAGNYDELFARANLHELCGADESSSDFLIRFALNHRGLSTMIIGSSNPKHITANVRAAQRGSLSIDVYEEAKRRLAVAGIAAGE